MQSEMTISLFSVPPSADNDDVSPTDNKYTADVSDKIFGKCFSTNNPSVGGVWLQFAQEDLRSQFSNRSHFQVGSHLSLRQ
jgi:hypothetical protein